MTAQPQPVIRDRQLSGIPVPTFWNQKPMKYADGSDVTLGDVVQIPMQDGLAAARIVMLGDTLEHAGVDEEFRSWVLRESLLDADAVVVEWVGLNPLAHQDPNYAPVGDYMFTRLDDCVRQVS